MNKVLKRAGFAAMLGLCMALLPAWAQKATSDVRISLGGTEIVVPLAPGYEDMAKNEGFLAIMSKYIPPQIKMQVFAMHSADLEDPDITKANRHPSYMVGSPANMENMQFSAGSWKMFRPMIVAQLRQTDINAATDKMMAEGNARMAKEGVDMAVNSNRAAGKQPQPDVWEAEDGSIRLFMVDEGEVQMLGQRAATQQDVGVLMMPVRERLLAFYIYLDREPGKSDPAGMRRRLDELATQVRASNP